MRPRLRSGAVSRFSITSINRKGIRGSSPSGDDTAKNTTLVAPRSGNVGGNATAVQPEGAINASPQPTPVAVEKHTPSLSLEKGTKAGRVNLRARLSKEKDDARKWSTLKEVWRLLRIARRETWPLLGAVSLLLVSSAVTISVPLTIGRVMSKLIYRPASFYASELT